MDLSIVGLSVSSWHGTGTYNSDWSKREGKGAATKSSDTLFQMFHNTISATFYSSEVSL